MSDGRPLCPCGMCGLPAQISRHGTPGYRKGHRPTLTKKCEVCGQERTFKVGQAHQDSKRCKRCAPLLRRQPRRLCACGCGGEVRTAHDRYIHGHFKADPRWTRSGSPEWRAKVIPKVSAKRRGKVIVGGAEKVAAVLRNKGVTAQELSEQLGIRRGSARQILRPIRGRHNITKDKAERLLRIAAGLPYQPTNRQKEQADRTEWQTRKRRERQGKAGVTEWSFISRFDGLLKQTDHLKDSNHMRKTIRNVANAAQRAKENDGRA